MYLSQNLTVPKIREFLQDLAGNKGVGRVGEQSPIEFYATELFDVDDVEVFKTSDGTGFIEYTAGNGRRVTRELNQTLTIFFEDSMDNGEPGDIITAASAREAIEDAWHEAYLRGANRRAA